MTNDESALDYILDILKIARDVTKPFQLIALGILAILVLGILLSFFEMPVQNAIAIALIVLALTFVTSLFVIKFTETTSATGQQGESPEEIPTDLKVKDDIFNRIATPLQTLGFETQHSVDNTKWGKTYYYSCAHNGDRSVCLLSLDANFFMFGNTWRERRWLNYLMQIPRQHPTDLVIFSETETICQEALYEMDDVRRRQSVSIVLLTKIIIDTFRQASTGDEDILDAIKWYLGIQ